MSHFIGSFQKLNVYFLLSDATKRPPAVEMEGRELVFGLISPPQNWFLVLYHLHKTGFWSDITSTKLVFGLISPPQNCTNLIRESSQVPAVKELLAGL